MFLLGCASNERTELLTNQADAPVMLSSLIDLKIHWSSTNEIYVFVGLRQQRVNRTAHQ
jgi:hypothetical protein